MKIRLILISALSAFLAGSTPDWAPSLRDADILVIGDSQIMFRGGDTYVAFFNTIGDRCSKALPTHARLFDDLAGLRVGVLGVRSTATPSWLARDDAGKTKVCLPEKSWPVNARGFGVLHHPAKKWFQIGQTPNYPLCQPGQSPIEALFHTVNIAPKLLIFSFLGRAADRWSKKKNAALVDAAALAAQVPAHIPCISMTTAPTFRPTINALRLKAQIRINAALSAQEPGCRPVDGLTPDTISRLEGHSQFYKTSAQGKVRDPFHPKAEGVRVFLETITPNLCMQIADSLIRTRGLLHLKQ